MALNEAPAALLGQGSTDISPSWSERNSPFNVVHIIRFASPSTFNATLKTSQGVAYQADLNLNLSAERAQSAAHVLNFMGLPYACLHVVGKGSADSEDFKAWKERHKKEGKGDVGWKEWDRREGQLNIPKRAVHKGPPA